MTNFSHILKSLRSSLSPLRSHLLAPRSALLPPRSALFPPRSSLFPPRSSLHALPSSLLALASSLLAFSLHAATQNFPIGTYIVNGSVKDGENKALAADSGTIVRAVDANGKVVAEASVGAADATGRNFLLEVPISSRATEKTAQVGDELNIAFVRGGETLVAAKKVRVTGVCEANTADYQFLPVTEFTKNDGSGETVTIPKEYLEIVEPWLDGRAYDPWGDEDKDGQSNYAEYLAGTSPFDASDVLKVRKFEPGADGHRISFEYVGGHVYGVAATPSLVKPSWATARVKQESDDTPGDRVLPPPEVADGIGETTIYVVPTEGAKQEFFKLEAR